MKISNINNAMGKVSFTRAIRPDEEQDYGQAISDGKKFAGVKNLALVLHGSSFPQANKDLFIGSPFNDKAAEVSGFLKMHGFDSLQLGPPGLIREAGPKEPPNYSPYISSINSKNYLFADMTKLTTKKYATILAASDINAETSNEYDNSTTTDFKKAIETYDKLFEKAYDNLDKQNNRPAKELKKEFKAFKEKSGSWLKTDSVFEVFKKRYETSDIEQWPDIAKNLISYKNNPKSDKHKKAVAVFNNVQKKNAKDIELYKFKQFIMDKQEKEFNKAHPEKLQYISDAIIGFSTRDFWANQDAFMGDMRVGCIGGGEGMAGHPANQTWDIPVVNPKTLFKEDGSLAKGGMLFKKKFENLLDSYQNIRVDHVLGLIDPWIYDKNKLEVAKAPDGEVISTNAHGLFLSEMNKNGSVDPNNDYSKILEKIVLPILQEKNLSVNDVVWESLGHETDTFKDVYYNKLNLPKIVDLKSEKGENKSGKDWLLLSTHDDPPFAQKAKKKDNPNEDYFENNKGWSMNPQYLIGFLHPEKNNEKREVLIDKLSWDSRLRVISKNQELLRCGEKVQMSFMDFFGLDKTYNKAGHNDANNWKLRLSKDYKKDYYKTLESKDWQKIALNMPELLKRAIISKIFTSDKPRAAQEEDFKAAKPLINKLDYYEQVLYEPENN